MIADLKPYPAMKESEVEWLGEVVELARIELATSSMPLKRSPK